MATTPTTETAARTPDLRIGNAPSAAGRCGDRAEKAPIDPAALPLTTPESRRACAQAALVEALKLCTTVDGKPDLAALSAAEDRYNTVLARELMTSIIGYVGRPSATDGWAHGVPVTIESSLGPLFEAHTDGRAPAEVRGDAVAAIVSCARNPCVTLGPFMRRGIEYRLQTLADPRYTGRPHYVETGMWRTWWLACVETLTSTSGTNGPPESVSPLDAPFCVAALVLARALLDMGTERADAYLNAERIPNRMWRSAEDGLSDHAARHWARMPHDRDDMQGIPLNLSRWHAARGVLVGFIGLLERMYNTHVIYDALGVAEFEAGIVRRSVPLHLFS